MHPGLKEFIKKSGNCLKNSLHWKKDTVQQQLRTDDRTN